MRELGLSDIQHIHGANIFCGTVAFFCQSSSYIQNPFFAATIGISAGFGWEYLWNKKPINTISLYDLAVYSVVAVCAAVTVKSGLIMYDPQFNF